MTITQKDLTHLQKLANLSLTPQEEKEFTPQINQILDYISELNEVNTENTESTAQTSGLTNITRNDEISPTNSLSAIQATSGTEKIHNDLFLVPPTIQKPSDE
jgi:aspartyl-tRNA(Asn)/glutamyl-tRNA(Gln) amidotransferase subunit C